MTTNELGPLGGVYVTGLVSIVVQERKQGRPDYSGRP